MLGLDLFCYVLGNPQPSFLSLLNKVYFCLLFIVRIEVCNTPPPFPPFPHQLDNLMTRYKKCCKRNTHIWFFFIKG